MKKQKKIIVKKSSIEGRGVFATRYIEKGEIIGTMLGKCVSPLTYERLYKLGNKGSSGQAPRY